MMEDDMMKKQTQTSMTVAPNSASSSSGTATTYNNPLPMHKNSRTISKAKPRIRIIHIFAPEIIKTDAANFRELVQRLTGKPTGRESSGGKKSKRAVKEEEVECNDWSNSFGGGFLGGFADLDVGFNVHEFGDFPFLPLDAPPHAMHVFDQEPQLMT